MQLNLTICNVVKLKILFLSAAALAPVSPIGCGAHFAAGAYRKGGILSQTLRGVIPVMKFKVAIAIQH